MYDPRATAADLETFTKSGFGDDATNIELDCLAVATCFDKTNDAHKAHAKLAKKVLKKHASAPTAAALSKITRRNYFPKHKVTRNAFLKHVERFDDFDALAHIPDFNHIGFAARLVALAPSLLIHLLARGDMAFFTDYFTHGHPRDTLEFKDLYHTGNSDLSHTLSHDEVTALAQIPRFTHLYIDTHCDVCPLPNDLSAWSKLTHLEIKAKGVQSLTQEHINALGALPQLSHLTLSMRLSGLPQDLSPLKRLTTLDLAGNRLKTLPDSIAALDQLQTLDLAGNSQLGTLPDAIGSLASLQTLELRGVEVRSCSPKLGQLHNLRTLHLSVDNNMAELFDAIRPLKGLTHLTLRSVGVDYLKVLPDALGQLTGLEILDINGFYELKKGFAGLGNLTRLVTLRLNHLPHCDMSTMLDGIGTLTNLEVLSLASANLKGTFPDQLVHCSKLRELDLSSSYANAPTIDFSRLPKLEKLDLRNIAMETYPKGIFTLSNLKVLKFGGNLGSAPNLPEDVRGLESLEELELGFAGITQLPNALSELRALRTISMRCGEELERLPEGLENLKNLERFGMYGTVSASLRRDLDALRPKMPWCHIF